MIGITLVGNPGTRALTVEEADDDGVSLALTVGDAVLVAAEDTVAEAEGAVLVVDCAFVAPVSEQPARSRPARKKTGTSPPRRFPERGATLVAAGFVDVALGTVTLGTVTRILRSCLTLSCSSRFGAPTGTTRAGSPVKSTGRCFRRLPRWLPGRGAGGGRRRGLAWRNGQAGWRGSRR